MYLVAATPEVKPWQVPEATCVANFTGDSAMYTLTSDATLIVAGERGGSLHLLQVTGLR